MMATTLGWGAAGALIGATIYQRSDPLQYAFVPLTAAGQWLVLRRRFGQASWWLLATTAGTLVAALGYAFLIWLPLRELGAAIQPVLPWLTLPDLGPPSSGLREGLSTLFDGIAIGTAQWLVLRRTTRGAGQWIAAMTAPMALWGGLSWSRGTDPGELLDSISLADRIVFGALNSAIVGFTVGVLTGLLLVRLVNQPRE